MTEAEAKRFVRMLKRFLPDATFENNAKRIRVRDVSEDSIVTWYMLDCGGEARKGSN